MENGTIEPDYETRLRDQVALEMFTTFEHYLSPDKFAPGAFDAADAFMAERARRMGQEESE